MRYYGVNWKIGSINSSLIVKYITSWIKQFQVDNKNKENNLIIVVDNASIHKIKLVKDVIVNSKIGMVAIVPYLPFLNRIESYIGAIKYKIR